LIFTWICPLAAVENIEIRLGENHKEVGRGGLLSSGFPHSIHHFAKQFLIGDVFRPLEVTRPFHDFAAEARDPRRGHRAEPIVEHLARLNLFAVDQQRARPGQRIAVLVVLRNSGRRPIFQRLRAILILAGAFARLRNGGDERYGAGSR
jgi:hypothetical protein